MSSPWKQFMKSDGEETEPSWPSNYLPPVSPWKSFMTGEPVREGMWLGLGSSLSLENTKPMVQDKTAVSIPNGNILQFIKQEYNLDSDYDVSEFLKEIRKNPLMEKAFLEKLSFIKDWADKGHSGAQNTYQSVKDALNKEDPMGLRKEGYQKENKLKRLYGIED